MSDDTPEAALLARYVDRPHVRSSQAVLDAARWDAHELREPAEYVAGPKRRVLVAALIVALGVLGIAALNLPSEERGAVSTTDAPETVGPPTSAPLPDPGPCGAGYDSGEPSSEPPTADWLEYIEDVDNPVWVEDEHNVLMGQIVSSELTEHPGRELFTVRAPDTAETVCYLHMETMTYISPAVAEAPDFDLDRYLASADRTD